MNAPLIVDDLVAILRHRYGRAVPCGKSRMFKFGSSLTCSINYSRLLGQKYFFGLSKEVLDESFSYPETRRGDFVLLVCGSTDNVLVLPRTLILDAMRSVATRRLDVFLDGNSYLLQTTGHPRLDVTQFLNAFPESGHADSPDDHAEVDTLDRMHVKMQWALIRLGHAEGCAVWVPPNDRNLSYQRQVFAKHTLQRLPNFGFDENTRRIVHNIDVLWLTKNVISKAFEIESTTMIYSGLLRLNDLILAQPNNQIALYIAASKARRERVQAQLLRPSFQPLIPRCQFLSFESLEKQVTALEPFPIEDGVRVSGLVQGRPFLSPSTMPIQPASNRHPRSRQPG